jgi:hypothetical protein
VLNAGTASFAAIDWFKLSIQLILRPIITLTVVSYIIQRVGERSDDGFGYIWQCNVFGPYLFVSPSAHSIHSTQHIHPCLFPLRSIENYNLYWKPSTLVQTSTTTTPLACYGRLRSKLRIFTDRRTGSSSKRTIPTKLRNTKLSSSPASWRSKPFGWRNRRIDLLRSDTC